MAHVTKISSSLSIATTVLLQACSGSGSGSDSGPTPVANTLAPGLVGIWQTACIATQNSGPSPATMTQASGGSGGGSGGVSGGEAYRTTASFAQDGHVEFYTESFSNAGCNANTLSGLNRYNAVYYIGDTGLANDGSTVTEIEYSDTSSTTYSIFQLVGTTELFLGEPATSSPGRDGTSEANRFDGLGPRLTK